MNFENDKIETQRLVLRRFNLDDAKRVSQICNSDEVWRGTLALPHPYTEDSAKSWINRHDENFEKNFCHDFAITDKNTGELYGCMGMFMDMANKNGELGYWIDPKFWNKGYATEAASAMIEYGFKIKGLHKIHARHFASNPASGRVMEKCGMKKEGVQEKEIFKIDRYEDVVLYAIIKD